jgi:hypothetical protein
MNATPAGNRCVQLFLKEVRKKTGAQREAEYVLQKLVFILIGGNSMIGKRRVQQTLLCILLLVGYSLQAAEKTLLGTWCVEEENLVITFKEEDSLAVRSTTEEGVNGTGAYRKNDTLFEATVHNGEVTIEMGYRYKWLGSKILKALPIYFTVDGDSVNHPTYWMKMSRCDPSTVLPVDTTQVEQEENAKEEESNE